MADIDKSLPNVGSPDDLPENQIQEEVVTDEVIETGGPIEITDEEDGGATIDFDPNQVDRVEGDEDHFANLNELLPEDDTDSIGNQLQSDYMEYRFSRAEWERAYITGLELLGFKYTDRTQPFQGASGATHPVLAEAVTQFQALAYKELLPADGPVRTQVMGNSTPQKEQQAQRVKNFMNYQLMDQMQEYEPEFDQMLFYLPLSGSTFKKVYYDDLLGRAVSKFIPADDLVVPYTATSLDDAEAVIHVVKMSENDLRKQMHAGFYSDIELTKPTGTITNELKEKEREIEGIQKTQRTEPLYTILECHVNLDLEGFEDLDSAGEPTGIKLPYIVTIEEGSRKVLSIRRNFAPNDPKKLKIQYFVHFKFLPGLGFYGLGLIHMIGGLSRTATAALRQLLDAGTLSNLPAGFKQRGVRVRDDSVAIQPGEFKDVDTPGGNLKDAFVFLPYKEPSQTLLQLMGIVVEAGQRFASIADMQVGDGNQQAAVGTTVALLERGSRVMSAIHKRLYVGLKKEFKLLAGVFSTYLPPEYPYDVPGAARNVKMTDFDERVDILPIADPNIFSMSQRVTLAQTQLQLAQTNPQMHNMYNAYRSMYAAIGVKDIDRILPPPPPNQPKDPAIEHIDALGQKPFQAFPGQDHRAHVTAHLNFMATNFVRNNPSVTASLEKNILEHISLMAQEQVQIEFPEEFKMMPQLQQAATQDPRAKQQLTQISQIIEARKAVLIADMTEEFMKEEKAITTQFDHDPLLKLKEREVDLKAMEEERNTKEDEARLALDRLKMMQAKTMQDEKLAQNEELANLRADTTMDKALLSTRTKLYTDKMKAKDVKTLKGPRS
jgi:hypothetical protein